MTHRWRALGAGFLLVLPLAIAAGMLEIWLQAPSVPPNLAGLLYGADLHLLLALVAVLGARLIGGRARDAVFPRLALGAWITLELATVVAMRVGLAPFMPPFTRAAGKLAAAAVVAAGLAIGLALTFALAHRGERGAAPERSARRPGTAGVFGLLAIAALLLANGVLAARAWSRGEHGAGRVETGAGAGAGAEADERPDVLVILVDTLRRDHIAFFGYDRPTTPNIDAFLRESFVCAEATSPSNKTIPAVASYFTGLYPTSHGNIEAFTRLPDEAPTLAKTFRAAGYRTAAFVANLIVTRRNGFAQGFDDYRPLSPPWWSYQSRTAFEQIVLRARHTNQAARAWALTSGYLRWLDAHPAGPHFAYVHYMEPHSPYDPPAADRRAVAPDAPDGPKVPPLFQHFAHDPECVDWESVTHPPTLSPADREGMLARYDGEIHLVDREVGRLLDGLCARGRLDRTHVVLLADHGEEFGEHGGWFHGHSLYDDLTGVVAAYRPPGGVAGGRVLARPVSALDLLATLFPKVGIDAPPLQQGRVIPELMDEPVPRKPWPVFCELPPYLYSLRLGHWKLVRRGRPNEPQYRLYDLATDRGERTDLAAALPDTLAVLRAYLDGELQGLRQISMRHVETSVDPVTLERLRSLGYVQ